MGRAASRLSALGCVRAFLLDAQQAAGRAGDLVAEGRDMGTVVFPNAVLKLYLTARPDVRAKRRYKQLINKGLQADLSSLIKEVEARDARDSGRKASPLKPAATALVVDNSDLGEAETLQQVLDAAHAVL